MKEKSLSEYYKQKDCKNGLCPSCKECMNKRNKKTRDSIKRKSGGLYYVHQGMKSRCYNKRVKNYHRYGGRGVFICDEWLNDFEVFLKWAKDNGYKKGLEIDRIDNNGNYEPYNCRFVTSEVNTRNSSNTKLNESVIRAIRIRLRNGERQDVIATTYGVSPSLISYINTNKIWRNV